MNRLLGELMLFFPVWPFAAICSAILFYVRHRNRIEPERRVPVSVYVLAVIVCGSIAGYLGVVFGIEWGCSIPQSGNLCGLIGFLIVGPISSVLGIVLLGLGLSLVRPAPKPNLMARFKFKLTVPGFAARFLSRCTCCSRWVTPVPAARAFRI
jgi:hypothetical protein